MEAPAHVYLAILMNWWPTGKSSAVSLPREDRIKEPQTTLVSASTLRRAAVQSFIWKRLCQPLVLFLDAPAGHPGLWVGLEYHAANHRELRDNGSGSFRPEPDWLHNILIPVSSHNGSKNGLRRLPSTRRAFPPAEEEDQQHGATSLVRSRRKPSVSEKITARASNILTLSA